MDLRFDAHSARRWAGFSGDFNPIHFDATFARKVGLEGEIVHGMLALLHAKQAVAAEMACTKNNEGWKQFKALFRSPLLRDHDARIELRHKDNAVAFRVVSGNTSHFSGAYARVEHPAFPASDMAHESRVGSVETDQRADAFFDLFPFVSEPWIFLDAMAFAEILRIGFRQQPALGIGGESAEKPGPAEAQSVMQMSHRVLFDPTGVAALHQRGRSGALLNYSMKRTEASQEQGALLSSVEFNFTCNGAVAMQVEVGLISREVAYQPLDRATREWRKT